MSTQSILHFEIEFHHTSQGSDLEIYNSEGDTVASFVGDKAVKLFVLLNNFDSENERNAYIQARFCDS